jgi:hypothetical protein
MIHISLAERDAARKYLAEALSINRRFSVRHAPEAVRALQDLGQPKLRD